MTITLGGLAIAIGLVGGLTFALVGKFVAKDVDRRIGLSFAAIGIVLFAISLFGAYTS